MKTQYNIKNLNRISDGYHETYLLVSGEEHHEYEYISEREIRAKGFNNLSDNALPLPLLRTKKGEVRFHIPRTFSTMRNT